MTHTPFLEDQEPNRLTLNADAAGLLLYDFVLEVIPAVADVSFFLELEPQLEVAAEGIGWLLDGQLAEQSDVSLEVDISEPSANMHRPMWLPLMASLDMSINPVVEVCVLFICNDWTPVEVPFEVIGDQQEHIFPPSEVTFPLPDITVDQLVVDLGPIEVGETVVFDFPVENSGEWYLEGSTLLFGGSGAVSIYPDLILAAPESSDGLSNQLSPMAAGPIEAVLQLHTNDPLEPLVEVQILASAIDGASEDADVDETVDSAKVSAPVGGCGCSAAPPSTKWFGLDF